jgi:hypothetical protein
LSSLNDLHSHFVLNIELRTKYLLELWVRGKIRNYGWKHICLSSSVYAIWKERNSIRHGAHLLTEEKILLKIRWEIRTRITSKCKYVRSSENIHLCRNWGLPDGVLC